ncbi:MAG: hypothetical protein LQ338_002110 [Usnochroma carphineum]|nr:MAG: hypothetical protein LQ338_002110 [Usnochroma carphineum]
MPPTSKTSSAMRRASSGLAKVSTPPSSNRTSKGSKASKIVCLKLSSNALARFAPDTPDDAPSPTPLTKQTPDATGTAPTEGESKPVNVKPEASSPPGETAGSGTAQPPPKEPAGKNTTAASSPKTGSKRGLGAGVDGPKPRARPGPKKKLKTDDANGENAGSAVKGGSGNTAPAHKLGPKANQGAINAGLRALDRTGKPCRKWQKSGFRLKTFTGVTWEISSWRAPTKGLDSEDSPSKGSLPTSNSQSKDNNSSSQMGSENSSATPDARIKDDLANSPLTALAVAT